jgi:hypothetical protein
MLESRLTDLADAADAGDTADAARLRAEIEATLA